MLVGEGYNELACFRGCAASLHHQSQEHGKANTELISKTSKGGPLPAKNHSHLSFCLLPPSLPPSFYLLLLPVFPLSVSPLSLHPLSLPLCGVKTFFFTQKKKEKLEPAMPPLLPSVLASARCKSSWHRLSWSCSGTVRGSHARALESSFTHKVRAHTHIHTL